MIVNKCKQASDVRIIQIMDHWMANTPVPATLLLITSDKDSAMALKKVERTGYNTILASDEGNVAQLLEYVWHKQLTWRELLLLEGWLSSLQKEACDMIFISFFVLSVCGTFWVFLRGYSKLCTRVSLGGFLLDSFGTLNKISWGLLISLVFTLSLCGWSHGCVAFSVCD